MPPAFVASDLFVCFCYLNAGKLGRRKEGGGRRGFCFSVSLSPPPPPFSLPSQFSRKKRKTHGKTPTETLATQATMPLEVNVNFLTYNNKLSITWLYSFFPVNSLLLGIFEGFNTTISCPSFVLASKKRNGIKDF